MRDLNEKKIEYLKFIVSLQHFYCVLSKILYKNGDFKKKCEGCVIFSI